MAGARGVGRELPGGSVSGFNAGTHFASDRVAKCETCERVGEGSWPRGWIMGHDGFTCPWCAAETLGDDFYCGDDGLIRRKVQP